MSKSTGGKRLVQQSRVVHCRQSDYDVLVDRTTKWGNPFKIGKDGNRLQVIEKYRKWVLQQKDLLNDLHELEGKILGCWCYPKPCHGQVLVDLANAFSGFVRLSRRDLATIADALKWHIPRLSNYTERQNQAYKTLSRCEKRLR